MKGKVYIVGAGPGDPELLTVKAVRVLGLADVVLHDDLVAPAILERISSSASILNVGKRCGRKSVTQEELNALLVTYASTGFTTVRLHGGDPLIFGRAGEEVRSLREAGVEFEIVPGVTAATSAAAQAGLSLTERHVASSVIFITGHRSVPPVQGSVMSEAAGAGGPGSRGSLPSPAITAPDSTFVVYMPTDQQRVASQLRAAGLDAATPCLIACSASTGEEQAYLTTLAELPRAPRLRSPKILIAGAVVLEAASTLLGKQVSLVQP
jgi:uroporphyrin-III C-methyltransferase